MTSINFSLSVVSVVYVFDHGIWPGLLLSCLVMIIFHWCYFKKILDKILEGCMDTPEKAIHFVILMKENNLGSSNLSLFKKKFKSVNLIASGYMQKEGLDPFKVREAQGAKEYENQVYEHIINKLTFLLNKNPNSESLALYIANLYLKKLKNMFMATSVLQQLADRDSSIAVKNSIQNMYVHLKNTCEKIYSANTMNLELKDYLEYKEKTELMKKHVDLETLKHIQFWQELGNKKLSIIKVYNLALDIDKLESKILSKYDANFNQDSSVKFIPSLLIYATYLQIIKETPHEAARIFKTLQTLGITRTASQPFDIYAENSCVITFSIQKGQLGTIIDTSASTQNLFHIKKSRLLGGTLHLLLPKVIAEKFTRLLGEAIKNPLHSPGSFTTYAKTNEGKYFEVSIQPRMHFHASQGLSLIVVFTKTSGSKSIIIVDEWNRIQDYSADLKATLNFEDTKQTPYRLNDILPSHNVASSLLNYLVKSVENSPRFTSTFGFGSPSRSSARKSIFRFPTDHCKQNLEDSILFSASQIKTRNEDAPLLNSSRRSRSHFQTVMIPDIISDGASPESRKQFKEDLPNLTEDELQLNSSRHEKINFCPIGQRDVVFEYNTEIKQIKLDDKIFKIVVLTAIENSNFKPEERSSPCHKHRPKPKLDDSFPENFPEDEERPNPTRISIKLEEKPNVDRSRQRPAGESSSFESSSLMTKNLSNKLQDALYKNQEKPPSVTLLQTLSQTEDKSSSGISQNRAIRTIKTLKHIFSSKETSPFSRVLVFFFYFVMILLLLLASLNFYWARGSFYQIADGLQIMNIASQRLTTSVDVWAKLLMILSRATDAVPNPAVARIFQGIVYTDTLSLIDMNFELHSCLQSTSETDLLNKAFSKDVQLWESSNNVSKNIFEGNTFLATDYLVNKFLPIANSTKIMNLALTSDYVTVLNNTANDYLLASEKTAIITQELLNAIIEGNDNSIKWILGLTCSSLAILLCILLALVWTIAISYKRLALTLVKIPHQQITQRIEQLTLVKQSLNHDVHTKDFANHQIQLLNKNMGPAKLANYKHVSESYYDESSWSRQILTYLIRYIGPAVLFILLICGISIKSVVATHKEFGVMKSIQEQLSVTTDAMYQTNMLFGSFYFIIMLQNQSNVFIRNQLPDDQVAYTINMVEQLNPRFLNAFSNLENANKDPIIENVLQNNLCDYVLMSDRAPGFCRGATKGSKMGLLSLVSNYQSYSAQYIELYQKNRTLNYAKELLKPYAASTSVDLAVIYKAFEFIVSRVTADLNINVETFVRQESIQLLIMVMVLVVSTALIRVIVKKRIQNFDLGRRRIMKNLSFHTIQGNKFFRYYLVKEFQKEIAGIKEIL